MKCIYASNKREYRAQRISKAAGLLICPVCGASLEVSELKSLICPNRHTYDITKQGYVNLMTRPAKTKYSKTLFASRRVLMAERGFFDPLLDALQESINRHAPLSASDTRLLDVGCGEGSHLSRLCAKLRSDRAGGVTGIGIDISKEGIMAAAKSYAEEIWLVADLAHSPFSDGQFDAVLNILSPSNYSEFNRILKKDGIVVKAVPRSGYLAELREALFDEPGKQEYSNDRTVARFEEGFRLVESRRVKYQVTLDQPALRQLLDMTPLAWGAPEARVQAYLDSGRGQITVDLDVLTGMKRK